MSEALPRRSDDERLIAVGRALAQSLLGGAERGSDPPSTGSTLSATSFIPPPSGVEPGEVVMTAPVRPRRRHGTTDHTTERVVGDATDGAAEAPPVVTPSPDVTTGWAFAPPAADAGSPPAEPDIVASSGHRLEFMPFTPGTAPGVEIEMAPRTVAVPEPVEVSGFVTELYSTLPFSPDEPEAQRTRLLRRPTGPARPVVPRPDEATIRMPDLRSVARPDDDDVAEDRGIATHVAQEWRGPIAPAEPETDPEDEPRQRSASVEWFLVIAAAFAVALLLKFFVIQSFSIPSESMVATLEKGDRVAVNKLAYEIGGDVERYDVVVFRHVDAPGVPDEGMPEFLIKRVIGLPGETIEARGGIVYVNGEPLDEGAHLAPDAVTNNLSEAIQVPPGEYFVMGDNRERSADTRVFGPVPRDKIVGRAAMIWWPLGRAGSL